MLEGKKILLVITGGIAAYKSLELIRLLQVNKASVVPVMTKSSQQFVTPLSVSAIAGSKVYTELFDLTAEAREKFRIRKEVQAEKKKAFLVAQEVFSFI